MSFGRAWSKLRIKNQNTVNKGCDKQTRLRNEGVGIPSGKGKRIRMLENPRHLFDGCHAGAWLITRES
jgi:hypothetical protein